MKSFKVLAILFVLVVTACKDDGKVDYKPLSIGQANSVTVVMSNSLWEGKVGDKVRAYFASSVVGIAWSEPILSLRHLPEEVFTGAVLRSRSVLFVKKKDTTSFSKVKANLYARPQKVAMIVANTDEDLIKSIESDAKDIVSAFKEMDMKLAQKNFLKSLSKETAIQEEFGVIMNIPSVYKVGKREANFVWLDRDIKKGTMNIIAYTLPLNSFSNESTFVGDIVRKRDSIVKQYIPGPDVLNKVTYMTTEKAFAPSIFSVEIGGKKAVEVRGRWEIHNFSMAGPFVSYIIKDEENNCMLVVEGFVFAPATIKRDFMFELESIIKTLKITPKN